MKGVTINIYEKLAFASNVGLLLLIMAKLLDFWPIAISLLIMLTIVLLHKINFDEKIDRIEKKQNEKNETIDNAVKRVDEISESLIEMKLEFSREIMAYEQRIDMHQKEFGDKLESNFDMLAKKIMQLENRLNQAKRTLAAYICYLEQKMESSR